MNEKENNVKKKKKRIMKALILVIKGTRLKLHTIEASKKSFCVLKQQTFGFCWTHIRSEYVSVVIQRKSRGFLGGSDEELPSILKKSKVHVKC